MTSSSSLAAEEQQSYRERFSIENFIHSRTRILNSKLEVLAFEIRHRLEIRAGNLERIGQDKTRIDEMLAGLSRKANYLMREHRDKQPFYDQIFRLEVEKRQQDVECWRDIVMVMRDFLYAWEGHEQARAKAILLKDV